MEPESDPDVGWVAALAGTPERRARDALEEARRETGLFEHLRRLHRREGRASYVEIAAPLELYALVRLLRPRRVLEVGVSSGVSSAYLLRGLERNRRGILDSIDRPKPVDPRARPPKSSWSLPAGRSSGWAIPARLKRRWRLHLGDKKDLIPALAGSLDRIDLFVYDVPHDDREATGEFARLDGRLRPGSVAIADHGPGGGLCAALQRWARRHGTRARLRNDGGLGGFAVPRGRSPVPSRPLSGAGGPVGARRGRPRSSASPASRGRSTAVRARGPSARSRSGGSGRPRR